MKVDINLYLAYRGLVEMDLEYLIVRLDEKKEIEYFYQNYQKEIQDNKFLDLQIDIHKIACNYQMYVQELLRIRNVRPFNKYN